MWENSCLQCFDAFFDFMSIIISNSIGEDSYFVMTPASNPDNTLTAVPNPVEERGMI